jgi:hypothetical protein
VSKCDTGYFETGASGQGVTLQANYFKLETHTDWCLYQYRVDFAPDEELTQIRKALLRNHKATLGGYIFDGTLLFTSVRLPQDVSKFHIYFSSIISSEIMSFVLLAFPLYLASHFDDNFTHPVPFLSCGRQDITVPCQKSIPVQRCQSVLKGIHLCSQVLRCETTSPLVVVIAIIVFQYQHI